MLCLFFPLSLIAEDEVLPSVSKEKMSEYKNAFGKAIAESKKVEDAQDEARKAAENSKDNFGSKVSEAARTMKEEMLKTERNFGGWVSKERRRSERTEAMREEKGPSVSATAKSGASAGRPRGVPRPAPKQKGKPGK